MPESVTFGPDPERLAALAEFAAGAGHEINNPLATIIGRAGQLLRDEQDPQRQHALSIIAAQSYRIRDMIGDVMAFARPPALVPTRVDLVRLVRDAVEKFRSASTPDSPVVELELPPSLDFSLDANQWVVVVEELLRNAREASNPEPVKIRVSLIGDVAGCRLEISDNGRGFSELERQHAFDPFFSGRQAGRGLGFGLCKVWRIVQLHGGDIQIQSTANRTTIRVSLPQTPESTARVS